MAMLLYTAVHMKAPWSHIAFVLIYLLTEVICCQDIGIPTDCSVEKQALRCDYNIPCSMPGEVTEVHINGYKHNISISAENYNNEWKRVVELDFTIDEHIGFVHIADKTFSNLKSLKILGIHGTNVRHFGRYIFEGLDNLESLDLSGCMFLQFQKYIMPALVSVLLPKLSSLSLSGVETADAGMLVLNKDAIDMLLQKSIHNLNLSNTNIRLEYHSKNVSVPVTQLDVSNITLTRLFSINDIAVLFKNLKTLIVNDNDRYNLIQMYIVNTTISGCDSTFAFRESLIENYYGNKISSNPMIINNSVIDFTQCSMRLISSLKLIHLQFNHIEELDAVFNLPENNITEIDISHNKITYISPMFVQDLYSLKRLLLAYNRLHRMQLTADFTNLLKNLTSLEEFNIAHNHLTFIPRDMFANNRRLRTIDLSRNRLETVDLTFRHLKNLTLLNLKGNVIKALPEYFQMEFVSLIEWKKTNTPLDDLEVNLEENDLECSCETKAFVKWMIQYIQQSAHPPYRCKVEGRLKQITSDILKDIEYQCIRLTIVIVSVLASCVVAVLLAIGIATVILRIRMRRRRDMRQTYLHAFRNRVLFHGKTQVKHIAFLAHSSADVNIITNIIYSQLDSAFKSMTGADCSTVCLGDRHFRPGFTIVGQTIKCIEESCVAIVLVSEPFCRSQWCELELNEAYEQLKPIILIFTETIDEDIMPPILLNVFRRQTRATLSMRDGSYVLDPPWEVLCEAVVDLASMHHKHERSESRLSNSAPI